MNKGTFYIMTSEGIKTRTGYIYDSGRALYGIANRGAMWDATDIITGALVTREYRTRAEVVAAITPELEEKLARAYKMDSAKKAAAAIYNAYKESGRLPQDAHEKSEPQQTTKTRRAIKSRTYNNFMRVYRAIIAKGYSKETAEEITRRIFDDYEKNPAGLPIWSRVDLVAPAGDSQTDETTADAETPAANDSKRYEDFCATTADGRKIWTAEAWDGGELVARETVHGDTYEKARDVAKFLFYGAKYITVKPCETAPQEATTGADSQTIADTETGNGNDSAEAPQTDEKTAPEEIPTDSRKAPPRGREKPHKGRKRGQHSPRPKSPKPERVFGFRGERVFGT